MRSEPSTTINTLVLLIGVCRYLLLWSFQKQLNGDTASNLYQSMGVLVLAALQKNLIKSIA
jgi:hypothetical protein